MKTNYVLIDFENIQPKNLEKLAEFGFKVVVFVGANQTKVPFELANAMQMLGSDGEYVKVEGNGQNALDFHIACYIGSLSTKNPEAHFNIISKDTGFDPLIKHLRSHKTHINRHTDIANIPILKPTVVKTKTEPAVKSTNQVAATDKKPSNPIDKNEHFASALSHIKKQQNSRPGTVKSLSNSINSRFKNSLAEHELNVIIDELVARKIVVKNGTKITYNLPAEPKALPGELF